MIGVVAKKDEEEIVREFFELFKVPWEFYNENRKYAVVISTQDNLKGFDAKLVLLYSDERLRFDLENKIDVIPLRAREALLKYKELQLPLYGKMSVFGILSEKAIKLKTTAGQAVGVEIRKGDKKIIRIGFGLFREVYFLLTSGQPVEFSHIPTLDLHISFLREWILESGIPLVEIPPVPAGYNFTCCLTHDIDFAGIRRHGFDHTIAGFLYRALFGSLQNVFKGKRQWLKLRENWSAVLMLPAVYMGLAEDFWMRFDRYIEIESGLRSTFFIIPFKNLAGIGHTGKEHARRATRYDVSDIKDEIRDLMSQGCDIGVHGIDAWLDAGKARQELERVYEATGIPEMGIRMHWLYLNDQSYDILEKAGYLYDSSCGYNDAVGYRSGTVQVFRPIGLKRLLELPLNIQDTALFYPDRMDLSEEKAWPLINSLLENAEQYGGVLTINWHDRSLAPERLWGNFYVKFIESLKRSKVWFDTASRVIRWFAKRRSASFEVVGFLEDKIKLSIESKHYEDVPGLIARIHRPRPGKETYVDSDMGREEHLDINFKDVLSTEIGG